MPFSKRRFNKVLRGRTKRKSISRVARTALRKVNQLQRSVELKKYNFTDFHTPTFIPDDGIVKSVTAIPGGASYPNRIANEIVIKNVNIVGRVTRGISASPVSVMRLVLFYDRQEVPSTTPALTEMFDPSVMGGLMAPYAQFNRLNVGRFQRLKSWRVTLTPNIPTRQFKLNLNLRKPHKVRFSGGNATDNIHGTIWFAVISDCDPSAAVGTRPEILCSIRTTFSDN